MKNFIHLFFVLILLISCSVKRQQKINQIAQNQSFETKQDNISKVKNQQETASFLSIENTSFEMEISSEKDSLGNSKEMILEHIRSPTSQKIRVVGGKVYIKQATAQKQFLEKDTEFQQHTKAIQTQKTQEKQTQITEIQQSKQVRYPFPIWWVLLILSVLIFIKWRFKLF